MEATGAPAAGPGAMGALLDGAKPLLDLLWARETEGQVFDSPERKAALDRRLQEAVARIPDELTRSHYTEEIRRKRWETFGGGARKQNRSNWQPGNGRNMTGKRGAQPSIPRGPLPPVNLNMPEHGEDLLEGAALLICALRPTMVTMVEARLERLAPRNAERGALLHDLLTQGESQMGRRCLETLRRDAHLGLTPNVIQQQEDAAAIAILQNLLDRLEAARATSHELARAESEIQGEADEGLTWRISQTTRARHLAERPELETSGDMDEDRSALSAQLSGWLDGQIWRKPSGR